ncbi:MULTISPECIES: TniB family NTP-binding protein [unclassified Chryseobacterium]|uniref:TniB family NTP-binding protein n=1 Tax=unclassified Chryseobacterium TaxID=2593645 RepID=UPI002853697F|nr:TniB family NTP-binding protein [Chryseobacterium sp. CFS7]MDR4891589.1 TniB family NTP-binding protein [Chryseobacterium sp. CFS7]
MEHLTNNLKTFIANSSNEERILYTKEFKWIGYTKAKIILDKMVDLTTYPKGHRMPNLLLVGESNNGKTALLKKFCRSHQSYVDEKTAKLKCPVLMIQSPPEPDEKRFYNAILNSVLAPTKTSEKIENRQNRVIHLLKELEVKVLIIDEIHHVLAGTISKQRLFLNVIKYLSNELNIPLVCSGTKLAFNAIQTDSQLSNRFEPNILVRWENNTDYKRLLASFEKVLPIKKRSDLIEDRLSNKILLMSDGLIGEISKILELSTILAINTQSEKITLEILNNIDYIAPQNRKKAFFNNGIY